MMIEDPILLWAIVGGIAGFVLGLAGTGGGVISIPLLMTLGGFNIKDASAYALLALTVGAGISWFIRRKNTIYPITGVLILFAAIVAFLTVPLKEISPPWVITLLLNLACVFSLFSLWVLRKHDDLGEDRPLPYRLKTASTGGIITGFLSTMTGLGGGVVIIPWLTGITRLHFEQAMACSLLTVAVTSPLAAWRQGYLSLTPSQGIALIGGIFITSLMVRKLTHHFDPIRLTLIRKLTLTAVILFSMSRTLIPLF